MKKTISFLLTVFSILTLGSCLGAQADITIRANGSGRIVLEYRSSQMLEAIGRLDGNEKSPAVPVGRQDFEQSLARIGGLRLASYSSKTQGGDLVTRAVVNFRDAAALAAFLNGTGARASLTERDGKKLLRLTLLENAPGAPNADLAALLQEVSAGYTIGLSLRAPGNASLALVPPVAAARVTGQGKKVEFTAGLADLVTLDTGLTLEVVW